MRLRDEIRLGVGALLCMHVLTMIAAVALLARMTPALDRILQENEESIRAVERMLLALADPASEDPERAAAREHEFERGLAEAKGNITEASEETVLADIDVEYQAALAGDPAALELVRDRLWQLGDINRESMLAANERAKRLGTAGAWVLVFLGLVGLVFSLALMRRARVKLISPVLELGAVLEACREGDVHRRFKPAGAATEFSEVAQVVNALVDEHFSRREQDWEAVARLDRVALLALLDREHEHPLFVLDSSGAIAATNQAALAALRERGREVRDGLARACAGEDVAWIAAEPLADGGWICRLRAQPSEASTGSSELGATSSPSRSAEPEPSEASEAAGPSSPPSASEVLG